MEMFSQFINQESKPVIRSLRIDDLRVLRNTMKSQQSSFLSVFGTGPVVGQTYLCMVKSSSFGKWSGTTICGFALWPDIFCSCNSLFCASKLCVTFEVAERGDEVVFVCLRRPGIVRGNSDRPGKALFSHSDWLEGI